MLMTTSIREGERAEFKLCRASVVELKPAIVVSSRVMTWTGEAEL